MAKTKGQHRLPLSSPHLLPETVRLACNCWSHEQQSLGIPFAESVLVPAWTAVEWQHVDECAAVSGRFRLARRLFGPRAS
jgi:hypothetical protein